MSIHELLLAKCELCSCEDPQLRAIFKQLSRKMTLLHTRFSETLLSASPVDPDAFLQVLRVVGVVRESRSSPIGLCRHPRLFKMLQKSLNCNSHTLLRLCEITAARLAERTYSLALLEAQLKNAADRVASGEVTIVKEEPKFTSLRTLPSEKEIKEMPEVAPLPSQTSLEEPEAEVMPAVPAFPFYYHFPIFFGSQ